MKKILLATAAVVQLMATPAAAQSYDPDLGTGNIAPVQRHQERTSRAGDPYGAYAQVPSANGYRSPVIVQGRRGAASGTDPDPRIQLQLRRESEQGEW